MKLTFDDKTKLWSVGTTDLRDFYIEERKKAKRSVRSLEQEIGVSDKHLYHVERQEVYPPNPTAGILLRALAALGYEVEIIKRK